MQGTDDDLIPGRVLCRQARRGYQSSRRQGREVKPIVERVSQPTPEQVRQARLAEKLSQTEATLLVSPAQERSERTGKDTKLPLARVVTEPFH